MANLRVFVSSTAYDLGVLRSSLRAFIENLGYDAVLSEYSDVLYNPLEHTHRSCLAEVETCDMVVLVIGSRFGSEIATENLVEVFKDPAVDWDAGGVPVSITQAEALTAFRNGIPVFAFVDSGVLHDHFVYQRNRGKSFAAEISYPSIAQQESATYIFHFLDYLQGRSFNNAVVPFERLEDLLEHLQKQWSGLFQRLLSEARNHQADARRIDRLADQFDDLKTALLATVGDSSTRVVARGVVRYRRLIDFLRSLPSPGEPISDLVSEGALGFWEMLKAGARITGFRGPARPGRLMPWQTFLLGDQGEVYGCRFTAAGLERLERDWQSFCGMGRVDREVVFEAVMDADERERITPWVRRLSDERAAELLTDRAEDGDLGRRNRIGVSGDDSEGSDEPSLSGGE